MQSNILNLLQAIAIICLVLVLISKSSVFFIFLIPIFVGIIIAEIIIFFEE